MEDGQVNSVFDCAVAAEVAVAVGVALVAVQ